MLWHERQYYCCCNCNCCCCWSCTLTCQHRQKLWSKVWVMKTQNQWMKSTHTLLRREQQRPWLTRELRTCQRNVVPAAVETNDRTTNQSNDCLSLGVVSCDGGKEPMDASASLKLSVKSVSLMFIRMYCATLSMEPFTIRWYSYCRTHWNQRVQQGNRCLPAGATGHFYCNRRMICVWFSAT